MRRWGIATAVVLAAIVAGAPAAHAYTTYVPAHHGTVSGWSDGDLGDCWGGYDLTGHFDFNDVPAVDTVAHMSVDGRCEFTYPYATNATITAPEFSGNCYFTWGEVGVAVNPFGGAAAGEYHDVQCGVVMTDGTYQELDFDLWGRADLDGNVTGVFTFAYQWYV